MEAEEAAADALKVKKEAEALAKKEAAETAAARDEAEKEKEEAAEAAAAQATHGKPLAEKEVAEAVEVHATLEKTHQGAATEPSPAQVTPAPCAESWFLRP